MVVGGISGEIPSKYVTAVVSVVSWIDECSLCTDSDTVLVFLGLLVIPREGGRPTAVGCDCGPCFGRGHCRGIFDLRFQNLHLLMKLLVLLLEHVLVVFDFVEFVLGGCDGCRLMSDEVFQRADQFPHLLGGNSTGGVRWGKRISPSRSSSGSNGGTSFEIVVREAGGGFLRVRGRGFGPSRWLGWSAIGPGLAPARHTTTTVLYQ